MRLQEILPIAEWLGSYSLKRLGPDGVAGLSLAVFAGITALDAGDPARAAALAAAIALMVGVIAIGGRFLGLANLAYFFSDSVVTGFKTGAALYIASTQIPKLLGLEGSGGNFFARLLHVGTLLPDASLPSFAVGAVAIALFLLL